MPMLATFANTFKIPELRKRILLTVGLIFASRLISMIPTPGVDWQTLQAELARIRETSGGLGGGLMDWFNVFSGGALNQCAIGFLSIWPYISASIIIQLLTAVIPQLERLAREGESGKLKLAYYTRYLTIGICVFQGFALATALQNPAALGLGGVQIVTHPGLGFNIMTTICMTAASLFVMWLADQITQRGIGNGTSLIIMINITSRLPVAIIEAWTRYFGLNGMSATKSPVELLLLLLFGFAIAMGTVMLTQGVRKVPIHSTRRAAGGGGSSYGMQQTYMPLRVNYTGVMPIIFAGPLIQFPSALLSRIPAEISWLAWLKWLGAQLSDMTSPIHLVAYAILIMFFAFFWVATQFNAMQISDNLKRDGSYVPGIRPGRATAEHLDALMTRVTLIGGTGLLIIALVPQLLRGVMQLPWEMASFFGGTSLLIIVGVALDTLRQMESHLLMRNYDGFLKHGRLRGRR